VQDLLDRIAERDADRHAQDAVITELRATIDTMQRYVDPRWRGWNDQPAPPHPPIHAWRTDRRPQTANPHTTVLRTAGRADTTVVR